MTEDLERYNYFDELMKTIDTAKIDGVSTADLIGIKAAIWTASNREAIIHLLNLLEDKGIMTKDERLELNKNVLKAMQKKLDEAAEKYPSIAEGLKQSGKPQEG
ncbi:MAG: hypothetical protein WCI87_06195 [Euryarchaeota archaeon]